MISPVRNSSASIPKVILAPMEGVVDPLMRATLTQIGGIDLCVTEFIRVTQHLLPPRVFYKLCPELKNNSETPSGIPVMVQLLGSNPSLLAENAERAIELGAYGIDLNFGCPARTVNHHRGGSVLLDEPELLYEIISQVRKAVPISYPVTAKIRLGYKDKSKVIENAHAVQSSGANWLTVHARTKEEGYRPPAHWEWIEKIRATVQMPVIANGDIWSVEDYIRCRNVTGCTSVMLGRGLIARPDLALQINHHLVADQIREKSWDEVYPIFLEFALQAFQKNRTYAMHRMKQWSKLLSRNFTEAAELFQKIKLLKTAPQILEKLQVSYPE